MECLVYQQLCQTNTGIMIFVLRAKCTVNNSQQATIDVCEIGLIFFSPIHTGKGQDFNRLRELIEILRSLILSSFAEQSIKIIFSEQHAY